MSSRSLTLSKPDVAFCTVCSDRFVPGLQVLLTTLNQHVRGFADIPFRVFHNEAKAPLSKQNQTTLAGQFTNVFFQEHVWRDAYNTPIEFEAHRPAYLALEAFRQCDVKRVIYLDSDMLCLGDLSELFFLKCDFAAVPCRNNSAGRYNTGLMIIGERLLADGVFDDLINGGKRSGGYWADQPLINNYIETRDDLIVQTLPDIYNFMHIKGHPDIKSDADFLTFEPYIRLVHWAGREAKRPKPWNLEVPLSRADQLWQDVRNATLQHQMECAQ